MTELVICRGIPASGKSTYAKAWVAAAPGRVRVNRDDIRFQMYGVYHGENVDENVITQVEDAMIHAALKAGKSVIVDDTNIKHAYVKRFAEIGQRAGATIRVETFFINLELALERNKRRDRQVPDEVIARMHQALKSSGPVDLDAQVEVVERYIPKPGLPKAILVDVDGTIAHNDGHRSFYDWLRVGGDQPIPEVIEIVQWADQAGLVIIVMSGRDGVSRDITANWLVRHEVPFDHLFMRKAGDQRKDSIVKRELFDAMVRDKYDIHFVLDDRNQVVDMWRGLGLRCLQVAPGDF